MRQLRLWALMLPVLLLPATAAADALIRTQAMLATTIAEYFVEADRVRVELEIGMGDIETFANLLPDDPYRALGREPKPFAERLARFFEHDLTVAADGKRLPGRLTHVEPRVRLRRDDITGEPLPAGEEEEGEPVVFARLEYALEGRPAQITFYGPRSGPASVGFVVYHGAVAVNDFRYLVPAQTLMLDWDDPWYSSFQNRGLRRQYYAPMAGFIYVDPYEVRKEIIARPLDLQRFVDLGLEGRSTIPPEVQPEMLRRVAEFLRAHHPVEIDGIAVEGELARINFLERTLKTSRVIETPEELDVYAAVIGAIFVYPTDGLPDRVTMDWDLWMDRAPMIPCASVDQAGPLPTFLEPDFRLLEWQNFLKNPELPTLTVLRAPPGMLQRAMAVWGRWLLLAAAVLMLVLWVRRRDSGSAVAAVVLLALFGGGFWWSRDAALSDERAREVVAGLLHNVYRAFDFRDEERIYDLLAQSASGDLLEQIYLETRRGLELHGQGGARARVKEVEVTELSARSAEGGAFDATTTWNVGGSVGHWGHVHQRRNRYRAELRVAPLDGAWKLVDLQVLEEERL
jgi:hypothetical protein